MYSARKRGTVCQSEFSLAGLVSLRSSSQTSCPALRSPNRIRSKSVIVKEN